MKFQLFGKELWDMSRIPPGLTLYTVRNELEQDFLGTLKKVADMGYKVVEFIFNAEGFPAVQIKQALNKLGLNTVSVYVRTEDLERDLNRYIEDAKTIGVRYIVTRFPREKFADESKFPELVSFLTRVAKELKRHGLQLAYHTHDYDFAKAGGKFIIDILLAGVGTDLLQLELDTYSVKQAGLDPKATLLKYKGITPLLHVKDMDRQGGFTEVGRGTIDWPPIFRILKDVGVKYYFVEQNVSAHPLKSAKISLDYLKSIGAA
ncbi:sugar phosphate isomerase/epimerase [Paenibacillus alkaliterrae]|uniref:sugar phosphate isomerase/epimerase family protein n=1 Tax=Paenibacillus alkaliterrae TaxID=320909 RepID=UPI001F3B9BF8|nr:sugar phosphate isomerase/epimerase [Paenibacillus alkaliterrae]MCF2937951.1 sugar phosphate isomerase/epimerase [Paenibacillus alkaliterrae]